MKSYTTSLGHNYPLEKRICAHCNTANAGYQCRGCRKVAYCNAHCQMEAWTNSAHGAECDAASQNPNPSPNDVGRHLGKKARMSPTNDDTLVPVLNTAAEVREARGVAMKAGTPIVLMFGVSWCRFCREFRPKLRKLAASRKWQQYGIRAFYVDVESLKAQPASDQDSTALAGQIVTFPTMRLYRGDGELRKEWKGTPNVFEFDAIAKALGKRAAR